MANILLIEDDPDTRALLRIMLELAGHRLDDAATAEDGLAQAQRRVPDVIVMDVNLPGAFDGIEATRRLRADAAFDTTAVVALTAHVMRADRERALAAGCDEYVTKPILDLAAFVRTIEGAAAHPQQRSRKA
jgi:CheY-like chemotaxis protein